MKCLKCGAEFEGIPNYCEKCGSKLGIIVQQAVNGNNIAHSNNQPQSNPNVKIPKVSAAVKVVIIVSIIMLIFFAMGISSCVKHSKRQTATPVPVISTQSTTIEPTTQISTTEPITTASTTIQETIEEPTTIEPTTIQPTTIEPTTIEPTTEKIQETTNLTDTLTKIFSDNNVEIYYYNTKNDKYSVGDGKIVSFVVKNNTEKQLTFQCSTITLDGISYNQIVMSDPVAAKTNGFINAYIKDDVLTDNPLSVGADIVYFDDIINTSIHEKISCPETIID